MYKILKYRMVYVKRYKKFSKNINFLFIWAFNLDWKMLEDIYGESDNS